MSDRVPSETALSTNAESFSVVINSGRFLALLQLLFLSQLYISRRMANAVTSQASGSIFHRHVPNIEHNVTLRIPQREAYRITKQHFEHCGEAAVLQLPVGCGKTGVICMLPFGIARKRVLVVAPNLVIREGLYNALSLSSKSCFWRKFGIYPVQEDGPFTAILDGGSANVSDLSMSHFVVANVQQLIAGRCSWLDRLPDDFFDMLIIDEGHHNAAQSWLRVINKFHQAKVISLTATPFRGDKKRLVGKVIYRYPFSDAMSHGYIKRLRAISVTPTKLKFTQDTNQQEFDLEEILRLSEHSWFRNGVALSEECNREIVRSSIQQCLALREKTNDRHQVIAATCSVRHADQVAANYRDYGWATETIHSKMSAQHRRNVMAKLRGGRLDGIVQVQVLGEGFDHPPLSVAAVFRPFRSLSPYIQFVGRIMRAYGQNLGIVVTHAGLNNHLRWSEFKLLDTGDQDLFHALTEPELLTEEELAQQRQDKVARYESTTEVEEEPVAELEITNTGITHEVHDSFTSAATPTSLFAEVANETQEAGSTEFSTSVNEPAGTPRRMPFRNPQEERREVRREIHSETQRRVMAILRQQRLHPFGWQVRKNVPGIPRTKNYLAIRMLFIRELRRRANIPPRKQRDDWTLEETIMAFDELPATDMQVRKILETYLKGGKQWPE